MTERVNAVVSGLVQGVGFRYFVLHRARSLDVGGWVRNRPDGAVEIEAEGETEVVDAFLAAIRQGPREAHVADIRIERTEISRTSHTFEVR